MILLLLCQCRDDMTPTLLRL